MKGAHKSDSAKSRDAIGVLIMLIGQSWRMMMVIERLLSKPLSDFFFCQHYAHGILQCLSYYQLICNSLQYEEFSSKTKILKRIAILFSVSNVLSAIGVVDLVFHSMTILEDTWHSRTGRYANLFSYCSITQMIIVA